ncbi:MAG TPA: hypothetical protein VN436_08910 [Holophaga sp.]|nr:hypothetical protein [Holophaga sp.]
MIQPETNHCFTRRRAWFQAALLDWLAMLETSTLPPKARPAKQR